MTTKQNQARNIKILAIDPGTREMGIAYLEDRHLLDYGVKTLRQGKSHQELFILLEKIIARLIAEKQPDVIALEKNVFSQIHSNLLLALVVAKIKGMAKAKKINLVELNPRTVRKLVCNNGNATKREAARTVAVAYPELKAYLESDKKWKIRYWQNIFDAVAVGLALLRRLQDQVSINNR
jgi:crossover junction endodeoxyribonuclease RuvC